MKKWQLWPKNIITQIFQRPYIFISILATASVNGNVMTTKLHKPSNDKVDVVAIRTIRSNNPNVMEYKLIDTESGTVLTQTMNRQR